MAADEIAEKSATQGPNVKILAERPPVFVTTYLFKYN